MNFAISGLIIGLVMALTGAGGALIAIPLFISLIGMSLKEASLYSLVAVVIASAISFFSQRKNSQYKTGLSLIFFSSLGSLISAPYKMLVSEFVIALILALVSLYALASTWMGQKKGSSGNSQKALDQFGYLAIPIGIALGFLTTFTGLGGGVLMMPVLLNIYHFDLKKSVATSLFVVTLSSLASLLIQVSKGMHLKFSLDLVYLILGILIANFLLKFFMNKFSDKKMSLVRKITFTTVVIIALSKIF